MAKWGKMDYKAFEKMANNFEEAVKKDIGEQLVTDILLEVGNKVLAKTKKKDTSRTIQWTSKFYSQYT